MSDETTHETPVAHESSEARHAAAHREFVREAVTMALYLSLSLLAVLLAVPVKSASSEGDPVGLLILTAIGLLVAHLLAFSISSRLVSQGVLDNEARLSILAQVVGGAAVVIIVTIPLLIWGAPLSIQIAEGLMMALVAGVGYLAARQSNVSRFRALVYVGVVIGSVLLVLALKAAVGH